MRPLIPGFRFRDGKLIISTEEDIRIIESWPSLKAIRKTPPAGPWLSFTPCSRLLRRPERPGAKDAEEEFGFAEVKSVALDPLFEKTRAFANFRYSVPPAVAKLVEPFRSRHWMLLSVCRRQERAQDLLAQSPALAFALAHCQKFRLVGDPPLDLAARYCARKQREITAWLGFGDSQACASILAKIPAEAVSLEALQALRNLWLITGAEKMLTHLPRINGSVLALLVNERLVELVSPKLLAEVSRLTDDPAAPPVARALEEILDLRDQLDTDGPLRPFQSLEGVRRKQRELVAEFEARVRVHEEECQLPPPPLPGTPDIVPLTRVSELADEGRNQHHCVYSYAARVKQGACYVYRVLKPERATLSIVKGDDGSWEIDQLYLACNQAVAPLTWRCVEAWLAGYSMSA